MNILQLNDRYYVNQLYMHDHSQQHLQVYVKSVGNLRRHEMKHHSLEVKGKQKHVKHH